MATNSYEQLQKYAELLNAKVLLDASEVKANVDKNISLQWAANKEDIAVLVNGDILISDPDVFGWLWPWLCLLKRVWQSSPNDEGCPGGR